MHPGEAYEIHAALTMHFAPGNFDAIKYNFKVRNSDTRWKNYPRKHVYNKLAERFPVKKDLIEFLLANIVTGVTYAGDMEACNYLQWCGRKSRLSYQFVLDMSTLLCYNDTLEFDEIFIQSSDGSRPLMMAALSAGDVSLESVVLFHKLTDVINKMPDFDSIVWPDEKRLMLQYAAFLPFDREKYFSIFSNIMNSAKTQKLEKADNKV